MISKVAAHFVEDMEKRMVTLVGLSGWHSEQTQHMTKEIYESSERELLKWADIDLTIKTV